MIQLLMYFIYSLYGQSIKVEDMDNSSKLLKPDRGKRPTYKNITQDAAKTFNTQSRMRYRSKKVGKITLRVAEVFGEAEVDAL